MPDEQKAQPATSQQLVYQIKIKGHLGQQWKERFEGLTITLEEDGSTLLSGLVVVDQAALFGVLKKVRDFNLTLLSVNRVEPISANVSESNRPII